MSTLDNASLVLIPAGYKAGKLYSEIPENGTGDFTVTRNSESSRVRQDQYIEFKAANVPTLDYSGGASCPKLQTQRASTNVIAHPYDFEDSYWTKTGASVELDTSTAGAELIVNGDFATDTDWVKAGTATIAGGVGTLTGDGTTGNYLTQNISTVIGKTYKLEYEITANSLVGGGSQSRFYESINNINLSDVVGTYTIYFTAKTTGIRFRLKSVVTSGDISIDNVSVKEVQGFASPFKDASGNVVNVARKLVVTAAGNNLYNDQSITIAVGDVWSESVVWKDSVNPLTYTGATPAGTDVSTSKELANGWYLHTLKRTFSATGTTVRVGITTTAIGDYYFSGLQFESGDPTSFINDPTAVEGSEVTRLADKVGGATYTGDSESGSLVMKINANSNESRYRTISLSDGVGNNVVYVRYHASISSIIDASVYINVTSIMYKEYSLSSITNQHTIVVRWKSGEQSFWIDGVMVYQTTSATTFANKALTQIDFKDVTSTTKDFYGEAEYLYVTKYLTDSEIQNLN